MACIDKPIIFIRADGGNGIGMGHIMRTCVLADNLKAYVDIEYVCLESYKQGIDYIKEKGYKVNIVSKENLLDSILQSNAIGILTDNYEIDDTYINTLKDCFELVGYIDDNAEKAFSADFILNQNFGAEAISYQVNEACTMLLGSQYVLLREDYKKANPIKINKQVSQILLTVGGSDPNNFTEHLLQNIKPLPYIFHVVIGPAFPYEKMLYDKYAEDNHIILYKQPNMCEIMQKCEVAISSCGSTLYELGSLGIPTIGISVADNQIPLAKRMDEANCIIYLGDIREGLRKFIDQTLIELVKDYTERKAMHKRMIDSINKNGSEEVTKQICSLLF